MKRGIGWIAGTAVLMFAAAPAQSATVCVNPNSTRCEATIQDGVDAAVAGDSVNVAAGVYNENVMIPIGKDGLTLRGGRTAVIDPDAPLTGVGLMVDSNDVQILGLAFRNGQSDAIVVNGTGVLIRGTHISGPSGDCIIINGDGATIQSTVINGCSDNAIDVSADMVTITGNRIKHCDNSCMELSGDEIVVTRNRAQITEDSYLIDLSGDDGEIVGNTLDNADSEAITASGDNLLISGNRSMNAYAMLDVSGANPVVTRNRGAHFGGDGDGIDVSCNTDCSSAEVSGNRIADVHDDTGGISVNASAAGMMVTRNDVRNVEDYGYELNGLSGIMFERNSTRNNGGDDGEHCFDVNGDNHVLMNNRGSDCHGDGANVSGNSNTFERNSIRDVIEDGIDVQTGNANAINDNRASNVNGVALEIDIGVTNTTADGNFALRVRHGLCDEGTGSVIGSDNRVIREDFGDQVQTGNACPID